METQAPPVPQRTLKYDDKVIKKIAGIAAEGVQGILTVSGGALGRLRSNDDWSRGIDAEVGQRQVALDMNVVSEFGYNVPHLFDAVTQAVSEALFDMTGLELVELNMHVTDVLSQKEFDRLHQKQHSFDEPQYQGYMHQGQGRPQPQTPTMTLQ